MDDSQHVGMVNDRERPWCLHDAITRHGHSRDTGLASAASPCNSFGFDAPVLRSAPPPATWPFHSQPDRKKQQRRAPDKALSWNPHALPCESQATVLKRCRSRISVGDRLADLSGDPRRESKVRKIEGKHAQAARGGEGGLLAGASCIGTKEAWRSTSHRPSSLHAGALGQKTAFRLAVPDTGVPRS